MVLHGQCGLPEGEVQQHPSQSYDSFPDVVVLPGLLSAVRLPRLSWVKWIDPRDRFLGHAEK